jgi:uncharacterized protein (TIGR02646 family)
MRKFNRLPAPAFLLDRWEQWGIQWEAQRAQKPSAKFTWRQVDGEAVNTKLLPTLKTQTQDHCSFCDNYPVSPPSYDTIEHFRPKAKFPRVAYKWENLYYCCDFCQSKGGDFDEALLCPDSVDYAFDNYFRWDFTLGTLEVNETASAENQQRARVTIDTYHLNDKHPSLRKLWLHRRQTLLNEPLDTFPYRDFIG